MVASSKAALVRAARANKVSADVAPTVSATAAKLCSHEATKAAARRLLADRNPSPPRAGQA